MKDIMSIEGIQIVNRKSLKRARPITIWVSENKINICATTVNALELNPGDKLIIFNKKNEWYIAKTKKENTDGYQISNATRGSLSFTARHLSRQLLKAFGTSDLVLKLTEYIHKSHPVYRIEERMSSEIINNGTNH